MSRRTKKNFNAVHITNLDDDLEELSLGNHDNQQITTPSKKIGHGHTELEINNDVFSKYNGFDSVLKKKGFDPFKVPDSHKSENDNANLKVDKNNSGKDNSSDEIIKSGRTETQKGTNTFKTVKPEINFTGNDPLRMRTTNSLPNGLVSHRSNNSVQYGSRTTQKPKVDKNQKGYGHEEKDLVLDDIEDF